MTTKKAARATTDPEDDPMVPPEDAPPPVPDPPPDIVGPVRLVDDNGDPVATVIDPRPRLARRHELLFQGRWYFQSRQDPDGAWVYRAVAGGQGTGTDPALMVSEDA